MTESDRRYYAAHKEEVNARNRARYWAHAEERRAYQRAYQAEHKDVYRRASRQHARRYKAEMIAAYGGCCACCGETTPEFLTLDHPNGDGAAERRQYGSQAHLINALRKAGWPQGNHRILCANCNTATTHGRICPHRRG